MAHEHSIDLWQMLFDQTPIALRWMMGALIAGILTMAAYIYNRNQQRVQELESYFDKRLVEVERAMEIMAEKSQHREAHILAQLDRIDTKVTRIMEIMATSNSGGSRR